MHVVVAFREMSFLALKEDNRIMVCHALSVLKSVLDSVIT